MMTRGMDWDAHPELDEQLATLWNTKAPASEIARIMGHGLSRNAVIGRANRKGLRLMRPKLASNFAQQIKQPPKPPKFDAPPSIEAPKSVLEPETMGNDRQCKHITGDPVQPGWQMCGNTVDYGYSYCGYHRNIVFDQVATNAMRKRDHG